MKKVTIVRSVNGKKVGYYKGKNLVALGEMMGKHISPMELLDALGVEVELKVLTDEWMEKHCLPTNLNYLPVNKDVE